AESRAKPNSAPAARTSGAAAIWSRRGGATAWATAAASPSNAENTIKIRKNCGRLETANTNRTVDRPTAQARRSGGQSAASSQMPAQSNAVDDKSSCTTA